MLPTVGLRTHIWNTLLTSGLLLAGFPVLLLAVTFALVLLVQRTGQGLVADMLAAAQVLPVAFPVALAVSAVWFAIAWATYQPLLDAITGGDSRSRGEENPRLWNLLENLCISRGLADAAAGGDRRAGAQRLRLWPVAAGRADHSHARAGGGAGRS